MRRGVSGLGGSRRGKRTGGGPDRYFCGTEEEGVYWKAVCAITLHSGSMEHRACMALLEGRCCRCTIRIGMEYVCFTQRGTRGKILPRGSCRRREGGRRREVAKRGALRRGQLAAPDTAWCSTGLPARCPLGNPGCTGLRSPAASAGPGPVLGFVYVPLLVNCRHEILAWHS